MFESRSELCVALDNSYSTPVGVLPSKKSIQNQAFLDSIFKTAHQIFIIVGQKLDFNVWI